MKNISQVKTQLQNSAAEKRARIKERKLYILLVLGLLLLLVCAIGIIQSQHREMTTESTSYFIPPVVEAVEAKTQQGENEVKECLVSKKFPESILKWCDQITRFAGKYDLPPDLVAAIIWQESGGNPKAYSSSGAVGLMQVMSSDGLAASFQCANGPCFANRPSTARLKNPDYNIKYGVRLLASLVKQHGELRQALKAYGPINVGYSYADKVISIYKRYK